MALLCHEGFDHERSPVVVGSHAYWRVYSTAEAGTENYISISNLEFRSVAGVAQQATGGTAMSSGDYGAGYAKAYAFDSNLTTTWISSNIMPNWIGYHFPAPIACLQVSITNRYGGYYYQAPAAFEVQYSDDGVAWAPALVKVGVTWATDAQSTQTFDFATLTDPIVDPTIAVTTPINDMSRHVGAVTWSAGSNTFVTGRQGLGRALTTNISTVVATLASRQASQFCGFRWRPNGTCTLTIGDSVAGAAQAVVTFGAANHDVSLAISGTTVWTSAADVWIPGQWYFVEVWPIIANSGGSIKILIDEGRTLSHTYSGDTQATANAAWDTITWDGTASGGESPIDDFYAANTVTGQAGWSACTTPIGDSCTLTVFATGNDSVAWTPATGAGIFPDLSANPNWQRVSETSMDGDISYNTVGTVGAEDTFNFGVFPNYLNAVIAVSTVTAMRRNGNATANIAPVIEIGGTKSYSSGHIPTAPDYVYVHDSWFVDPSDSSNLTLSNLNAMKAGYKLLSVG